MISELNSIAVGAQQGDATAAVDVLRRHPREEHGQAEREQREIQASDPQSRNADGTPTAAAMSAATGMVASKFQPWSTMRIAVVNAPIPKNAP